MSKLNKFSAVIVIAMFMFVGGCSLKSQDQRNQEVVRTIQLLQSAAENHRARNFERMLVDANAGLELDNKRAVFHWDKAVACFHLGDTIVAKSSINKAISLMESGKWSEGDARVKTQEDARIDAGVRIVFYAWRGVIESSIIPYNLLPKRRKEDFPVTVSDNYMFSSIDETPNLNSPGLVTSYIYAKADKGNLLDFVVISQSELDRRYFYGKEKVNGFRRQFINFDSDPHFRKSFGRKLPIFPDGKYDYNMKIKMISPQKIIGIGFFSPVGSKMASMSFDELLHTYITKYTKEFLTP
ncbi:hypothetical protein [Desulfovibrio sp. UCD-KL4C]|uniref:hypothetical protein n=1 Tax=Desulfovibrio sp. UCD-KL4C TaxID=2578120 RepID=UPI0025BC2CF9|nr:hypothetical protein [Desulfovibrio sp. UCD-KL4C]